MYKDGEKISETNSDDFGDFKFDGLEPDSGNYELEILYQNNDAQKKSVNLKDSEYLLCTGLFDGHENDLRELAKQLNIENYTIFKGFRSGDDKNEILKCSDIVVQLSRFEQGAWAPLEGVLCKTPILVTDHTGTGEDIKRLNAGYLVKMDDLSDLSNKLEKGKKFNSRSIKVNSGEGYIMQILSAAQENHKDVQIGSYPFEEQNNWRTTVVIRGQDLPEVKLVTQELKDIFNKEQIEFTVEG